VIRPNFVRWLRFNAVGAAGIVVQLGVLAAFTSGLGVGYLVATALAVETAVLHNFFWHERWTWGDRTKGRRRMGAVLGRLLRFNLSNGLVSILTNLVLMRVLVGRLGLHYLPANMLAIAAGSLVSFLMSHLFVFRAAPAAPTVPPAAAAE
jgi:putative flippase GtrA